MNPPLLIIVVPCYNEEDVLHETIDQLSNALQGLIVDELIGNESKLLFVDDGSQDKTWSIIFKACIRNQLVKGLKLSRNVGHQNALLAGLYTAKEASDCVITIDADLQDDISVIHEFINKFNEGNEIVYGVRQTRDTDSFFKRNTAVGFYKVMQNMGVSLVYNHADYRLMSKRAIEELERFEEVNLFLRGMVPLIGFQSTSVYYDRKERMAGKTKYPIRKMLSFAFDGITSFSVTPIRMVLVLGILSFFISLAFGTYFLALKFSGNTQHGWTSLITSIWLIGGLQLIAIGLIGEYIGKIYKESKRRPKFIIDKDLFNLPLPRHQLKQETYSDETIQLSSTKLSESN